MEKNTIKEDKSTNVDVSFSPQEVAIGAELSRNPSYKEIARKTSLSPKMVAYYMSTMMKKREHRQKKNWQFFLEKMKQHLFTKKNRKVRRTITVIASCF